MPAAERAYLRLSDDSQRECERILRNIGQDPWVNNQTIFAAIIEPMIGCIYRDTHFWITFQLVHNEIIVFAIKPVGT